MCVSKSFHLTKLSTFVVSFFFPRGRVGTGNDTIEQVAYDIVIIQVVTWHGNHTNGHMTDNCTISHMTW